MIAPSKPPRLPSSRGAFQIQMVGRFINSGTLGFASNQRQGQANFLPPKNCSPVSEHHHPENQETSKKLLISWSVAWGDKPLHMGKGLACRSELQLVLGEIPCLQKCCPAVRFPSKSSSSRHGFNQRWICRRHCGLTIAIRVPGRMDRRTEAQHGIFRMVSQFGVIQRQKRVDNLSLQES